MCCVSPRWSGLHVVIFSMMAAFTACTTGCRSKDVLLLSPSCINSLLKAIVLITEVTLKLIHSSHATNVSGSEPTLCWSASFVPVMHALLTLSANKYKLLRLTFLTHSLNPLIVSLTNCVLRNIHIKQPMETKDAIVLPPQEYPDLLWLYFPKLHSGHFIFHCLCIPRHRIPPWTYGLCSHSTYNNMHVGNCKQCMWLSGELERWARKLAIQTCHAMSFQPT